MTAKAGLNRHYQHHVKQGEKGLYRFSRGAGLDGKTGLQTLCADVLKDCGGIGGAFVMNGDAVSTCIDKIIDIALGTVDHQMYVKKELGVGAQRLDYHRTKAHIGHKIAVHHVKMQHIGTCHLNACDRFGKMGKVSGNCRRGNFHNKPHKKRKFDIS